MSTTIRNAAALIVGTTYNFTRNVNGFTYKMTFTGTSQDRRPTQEAQWLGNNNPLETVYSFDCVYPNGFSSKQYVWEHDIRDGAYTDGFWTPCDEEGILDAKE
jgi:hypothetical protein